MAWGNSVPSQILLWSTQEEILLGILYTRVLQMVSRVLGATNLHSWGSRLHWKKALHCFLLLRLKSKEKSPFPQQHYNLLLYPKGTMSLYSQFSTKLDAIALWLTYSLFQHFLFSLWNPSRKHSEFSAFYAPSSVSPTTTKFFPTSSKRHRTVVPSEWPSSFPDIWLGVGEWGDSLHAPAAEGSSLWVIHLK